MQMACLWIIRNYEEDGRWPTTYDIAAKVYQIKPDKHGVLSVSNAQHVATKRALEGLQRKGRIIGFRTQRLKRTHPFAYAAEDRPGRARFIAPLSPHPSVDRWAAGFLREDGSADTHELLRRHDADHQTDLQARGAAREGYPGSDPYPEARERELSRLGGAHDRGDALAWNCRAVRIRICASCRRR